MGLERLVHGGEPEIPSSVDDLIQALALDPNLKVIIAHGMTDTITPYFATKYIIDHVPAFGDGSRLQLKLYPGGHMNYSRDASRAALRADAIKLYPGDQAVSGGQVAARSVSSA